MAHMLMSAKVTPRDREKLLEEVYNFLHNNDVNEEEVMNPLLEQF